jgi:hypothetical protein
MYNQITKLQTNFNQLILSIHGLRHKRMSLLILRSEALTKNKIKEKKLILLDKGW